MRSSDRKSAWTAIRNALLIVAIIHVLVLLRGGQLESFSFKDLIASQPGQLLRWLAWSLVAPGIGLLAQYFATRRLKWLPAIGKYLFYASQEDVHWVSAAVLEKARPTAQASAAAESAPELFDAVRGGDSARFRALVNRNPSLVGARNARGSTPLHVAVDVNNPLLVRYLIGKGANPNAVNHIHWTPLFYAKGVEAAGLLVDKGADVNFLAGDITPLIHFIWSERREGHPYLPDEEI